MTDALPRPGAPSDEAAFTLSIDDAAERYAAEGFPRPKRRLQKYCARGDLECRKVETSFGEQYLITPESVARHVAYIRETATAAGRAPARPDAPERAPEKIIKAPENEAAPEPAPARPGATAIAERLENENDFLRKQIGVKDEQIKDLTERARETNILIQGLQNLVLRLNSGGDRDSRS